MPSGAVLHIKGSGGILECDLSGREKGIAIDSGGSFVLEDGTVKSIGPADEAPLINANGTVTVNGGTLQYTGTGTAVKVGGSILINDGKIESSSEQPLLSRAGNGTVTIDSGILINENGPVLSGKYSRAVSGGVFNQFPCLDASGNPYKEAIAKNVSVAEFVKGGKTWYAVGDDISNAVYGLGIGDSITLTLASMELSNVPVGVTVTNNTGVTIKVNGRSVANGCSTRVSVRGGDVDLDGTVNQKDVLQILYRINSKKSVFGIDDLNKGWREYQANTVPDEEINILDAVALMWQLHKKELFPRERLFFWPFKRAAFSAPVP